MAFYVRVLGVATLFLGIAVLPAPAGDDASGPVHYSVDLSRPFTTYVMTETDKEWVKSLVKKFGYSGRVIHFVRTSLPLLVDNQTATGEVYQAVEKPEIFYVVRSDAMLQLHTRWPYNPGVRGFSAHAPKSRNFIVALNFFAVGVPVLSSSPVEKGLVIWQGHAIGRLK